MSPEAAAVVTIVVRALMLGGLALAVWSIQRDLRAAWPRIVELFTEEEQTDDDA